MSRLSCVGAHIVRPFNNRQISRAAVFYRISTSTVISSGTRLNPSGQSAWTACHRAGWSIPAFAPSPVQSVPQARSCSRAPSSRTCSRRATSVRRDSSP